MFHNLLVLINSSVLESQQAIQRVFPYLDHFGVPYSLVDLRTTPLPENIHPYQLILLAHPNLDDVGVALNGHDRSRLRDAVRAGSGLVSFDPRLSGWLTGNAYNPTYNSYADRLEIISGEHYVTQLHPDGEQIALLEPLALEDLPDGESLVTSGMAPLLTANYLEKGRLLNWASTGWMHSSILGPLAGLDDLFWRGLVWASRKPFVMRGLPPLMTMRVDDVCGRGSLFDRSPLYWVEESNQAGFKPWLGLFIYNIPGETANQLRGLLQANQATAFPHAFGRPNRMPDMDYYYDENAIPLRAQEYDEFIYLDHQRGVPWSDAEAQQNLEAVDRWYAAHAPLPLSPYAIPHWGEMGSNVIAHIHDDWGCDLVATYHGLDATLDGANWLVGGPFRKYETPGSALFDRKDRGDRPVFYADFINFAGKQFFLSFTEVRDQTGYEWAPDNNVQATIQRGVKQLRRSLDSMALPTLFTHETDYIHTIQPENWSEIIQGVAKGIAAYHPIHVTLDEGIRYLRALKTSKISDCQFDPEVGTAHVTFTGKTDQPTFFYAFTGEGDKVEQVKLSVPAFQGGYTIQVRIGEG